jgi:CheY-like chemotaxis protein
MPGLLDGIRVLIVEDHEDSRLMLAESLRFEGASVESVATAEAAANALDRCDVIITDFALPDHDGVWLLEQSMSRARPVPVILLSGYAERQREIIASAPFALKLLKPTDPLELSLKIARSLGLAERPSSA